MKELHITLSTGETHEIPMGPSTTITVRGLADNGAGVPVEQVASYAEVAEIEIVDVDDAKFPEPQIAQESPHLSAPQTVLQFAQSGPVADAATLVEQAVERYPGDPQVAEAQQVIADRMAGDGAPVPADTTAMTETPVVEHDEAVVQAQIAVDAAAAGAPVDHIAAAIADVDAALAIYPDSAELADAKAQLEQLHAVADPQGQGS